MNSKNIFSSILLCLTAVFLLSCSEYNKILKGSDYDLKFEKAKEYYEKDQCYRSLPLLDELMSYFRMTNKGEEVYYYYAKTQYCMGDYYLAGYYYKRFVKNFPQSYKAEECAFNAAICMMRNSPDYYLDQSDSYKAIDEFQLFMSKYPNSVWVDSCNTLVKDLRSRLEKKVLKKQSCTTEWKNTVLLLLHLNRLFPNFLILNTKKTSCFCLKIELFIRRKQCRCKSGKI